MKTMTPIEFRELFARRIVECRKKLGWSQAELARRMGTTSAVVCDYERSRQSASLDTILKFANVLGVRPASLMDASGRGRKPPAKKQSTVVS